LSTDFSNAADIRDTETGGYWYAEVADGSKGAAILEFCLKVEAGGVSTTVDNLKLTIIGCDETTITTTGTMSTEQRAVAGGSSIKFLFPTYKNTRAECIDEAVDKLEVYQTGCST